MGRFLFRLPDVGEGVAEAEIVAWHVKPGDQVAEDQPLVDVMTDKATVEMTSPTGGVIIELHGEAGAMAPVGSVLAVLDVEGAAAGDVAPASTPAGRAEPAVAAPAVLDVEAAAAADIAPKSPARAEPALPGGATRRPPAPGPAPANAPVAAPATRRRAHELGIPLQYVPGTGPGGRITPGDLDRYIAAGPLGPAAPARYARRDGVTENRLVGLRRRIAEKMQESKRRIPHFGYVEECDLTELEALRLELNAGRKDGQPKLTLLPFFMRALVRTLPDFPNINARFDDDAGVLTTYEAVHIGIATQTPGGLMVPVVRHAEALDLWECAAELAHITAAAREGRAPREALSGSTITLTSLGPLGGLSATPVINHPEVAIIGPNKLRDIPVVRSGQITIRRMMNISTAFDHRIVDGDDAARFVQALKRLLEHPALIFVD